MLAYHADHRLNYARVTLSIVNADCRPWLLLCRDERELLSPERHWILNHIRVACLSRLAQSAALGSCVERDEGPPLLVHLPMAQLPLSRPRRGGHGGSSNRRWLLPLLISATACLLVFGPGLHHAGGLSPSSSSSSSLAVVDGAHSARESAGGKKKKRVAYAFYASDSRYACSALVNMARLRSLGGGLPPDTDLVLLLTDNRWVAPGA